MSTLRISSETFHTQKISLLGFGVYIYILYTVYSIFLLCIQKFTTCGIKLDSVYKAVAGGKDK